MTTKNEPATIVIEFTPERIVIEDAPERIIIEEVVETVSLDTPRPVNVESAPGMPNGEAPQDKMSVPPRTIHADITHNDEVDAPGEDAEPAKLANK